MTGKIPRVSGMGIGTDGKPYIPLTEKEFVNRRRSIGKSIDLLPELKKEMSECLEKIPLTSKEIIDRKISFCKAFDKILPEIEREIATSPTGEAKITSDIAKRMAPEFEFKRPAMSTFEDLRYHLWGDDYAVKPGREFIVRRKLPEDQPPPVIGKEFKLVRLTPEEFENRRKSIKGDTAYCREVREDP